MSWGTEDPEASGLQVCRGFYIFVRVMATGQHPRSYLMLMKEPVERPILSDRRSNSRTPSFRLRGLRRQNAHIHTHTKTHTYTNTHKHTGAGKTHSFIQTHEVILTGWTTWRKSCTSDWWRCSRTPQSWQLVRSSSGCPGSLLQSNLSGLLLGRGPWRWRVEPLRGASYRPLNPLWSDGLILIKILFKCV